MSLTRHKVIDNRVCAAVCVDQKLSYECDGGNPVVDVVQLTGRCVSEEETGNRSDSLAGIQNNGDELGVHEHYIHFYLYL